MVLLLKAGNRNSSSGARSRRVSLVKLAFIGFLALLLLALIVNTHVTSFGKKYILKGEMAEDFLDDTEMPVAIVLGASVYSDGTLSPLLEERAVTAFDLYSSKRVKKILVSGDNHVENYNEVIPIRDFLIEKGVPAEDVFTDFAGFDTYDTMYRAVRIFGVTNALVVTQSFHLPRALFAARNVGLDAYGVPADKSDVYIRNNLREFFATAKTYFEVVTDAPSLFLGRQIPIEGDGRESLK
jgi:SanA protein